MHAEPYVAPLAKPNQVTVTATKEEWKHVIEDLALLSAHTLSGIARQSTMDLINRLEESGVYE